MTAAPKPMALLEAYEAAQREYLNSQVRSGGDLWLLDAANAARTKLVAALTASTASAEREGNARLRAALEKVAAAEVTVFDEDVAGNVQVEMEMDEAAKIARQALGQEPRFAIVNDGPGRWVLVDNWSDDPCPVYESREAAQAAVDAVSGKWEPGGDRCDVCDNGLQGDWIYCPYCGAQNRAARKPATGAKS